jgi:hypothetical protein
MPPESKKSIVLTCRPNISVYILFYTVLTQLAESLSHAAAVQQRVSTGVSKFLAGWWQEV